MSAIHRALRPNILIVEDDPLVRTLVADMMDEAGLSVVEAGDAAEAVAILEANDDIEVVFSDVDMPGTIDGLQLVRAIKDRWPPVSIILTSGRLTEQDLDLPFPAAFFPKPYNLNEFVTAIRNLANSRLADRPLATS